MDSAPSRKTSRYGAGFSSAITTLAPANANNRAAARAIPEPAPALAHVKSGSTSDVIGRMGRFSRLTRPFNALGLPALSLPCGAAPDGRPLAMQLVGRPFDEATLLRLGHAYERATAWHRRRPALP